MKLGKKAKRGLLVLGGLLLLLVLAHTPPAKSVARWGLVRVASSVMGGSVSVEILDYRLWRGELELSGVSLQPATELGFVLSAERIVATVSPTLHLSAQVDAPDLALRIVPSGLSNTRPTAALAWLHRLHINDGVLRLQQRNDVGAIEEWLTIEAITADLVEEGEQHGITLHADRALGRTSFFEVALDALDAELSLGVDSLRVVSASLFIQDSYVRAEGELDLTDKATGAIDLRYAVDGSLARFIDEGISISGIVSGTARVGFDGGELGIEAEASSDAIEWAVARSNLELGSEAMAREPVALTDVEATVRYEGESLRIERARATSFGGELGLTGEVEVRETGARHLELTFSGLDVPGAARWIAGTTLPFGARVGGDARADWSGGDFDEVAGDARIRLEPGSDLVGNVRAGVQQGRVRLETDDLVALTWDSSLSASADIDLAERRFEADYSLRVTDVGELPIALPLAVGGALEATGSAGGTFDAPEYTAEVASDSLRLNDVPFVLSGGVEGTLASAVLRGVRLEGAGGVLSANGTAPLGEAGEWAVTATAEDFAFGLATLVEGVVDADIEITGPADAPDWTADIRVPTLAVFGVAGTAAMSAGKSGRDIRIRELVASYAGGSVEGDGTYALDTGAIEGGLLLRDLQVGQLPLPQQYAGELEGVVELEMTLAGTLDTPAGEARLALQELSHNGIAVPAVALDLVARDGRVLIEGTGQSGPAFLVGEVRLEGDYPLHADIELEALPFNEWMGALAAGGDRHRDRDQDEWALKGTAQVDVSLAAPEDLTYSASIESMEARFPEGALRATPFGVSGNVRRVRVDGLEVVAERGRIALDATVPLAENEEIDLVARGRLDLALLGMFVGDLSMVGSADLDLVVTGPLSAPRSEGSVQVMGAEGSWRGLTWTEIDLTVEAASDRLITLLLSADALGGHVELMGELPRLEGGPAGFLEIDARDIDLVNLLPLERRTPDLTAETSLRGRIEVPGFGLDGLSGSGEMTSFVVTGGGISFGAARAAPWRLEDGGLSLPDLRLEGDGAELNLQLAYLRWADGLDFHARAGGRANTRILNPVIARAGMQVGGEATLDIDVMVADGAVALGGGGTIRGGRFVNFRPQFSLNDASVDFELSGTTLEVTRLEARSGTGRLLGSASVDWSELDNPLVDLRLDADSVPLEIMAGFRSEVGGELRLSNREGPARLTGRLLLDRGIITREFNDDQQALSSQSVALRDPSDAQGALAGLDLDLVIATERNVFIENSTARLEVAGSVSVGGTVAVPEAGGILTLVPDGTFNIGPNRLQIISGRVDLTGVPLQQPYLDIRASARVGATTINVDVEGYADDLRTRLTAPDQPDLTEGDLASLLVTGRTLENAGEGGAQIASAWAISSLAGLVHEGLGDLITFGPPPGAGPIMLSEEADPTARLSFGFPVTERLSVTYSIGLDSTERRLFILDYRVARNIWLRAIQEDANDFGLGISQRFELDLRHRPREAGVGSRRNQVVGSVSVEGLPPGMERRPRTDAGDRYDYWAVRDEADTLREELIEAGFLSAVVDFETTTEEGESADAVSVHFAVSPGISTSIVWRGDDPGRSVRREIERRWDGRVPEEFLLVDATRSLRTQLRSQRYFGAEVVASIEPDDSSNGPTRRVVFDVNRGPRGDSVALSFDGNVAVSDAELAAALPGTGTPEFFLLLEQPADLARGLRLRYAAEGFLDAVFDAPRARFDAGTGIFYVEVPIDEGNVTRVAAVDFGDDPALDRSRIAEAFGVVPGTAVDFPEIRAGQARVRALYRSEGFSDVRAHADLTRSEQGLDVALVIEAGVRARVGEIRIVGNARTLPRVILNELTFASGDPIRLTEFQRTQKRLYDLTIFRSADVRPDPEQQGQEIQDVLIQLVERSDVDVTYGVRYNWIGSEQSISSESEPRASGLEFNARVNLLNQFRRGTNLGFSVFYQGNHQLFRGILRMPTFFGSRIVTEFIVEREDETFVISDGTPALESRGSGVTFQQTRKLTDDRTDKFALQWNFRYAKFRADRFTEEGSLQLIDTYRPRFGVSLIEDRRDSFVNPTRGRFWNVTVQAVPEIWGSDVGFVRIYGQAFFYYPLFRSVVWASGYRAGVSTGSKEFLLIEDRFQAGGANSVRGYKQNTLGPAVFVDDLDIGEGFFYIGGQAVAVINQELRFPIWKMLHGGLYWDAGNVWATARGFGLADLRHTVGAGVRIVLPFGALRFDYAEPLNPCSPAALADRPISFCAADIVRFHFAFGYAF